MRGMRACAAVNAAVSGIFLATAGFFACASGPTPPPPTAGGDLPPGATAAVPAVDTAVAAPAKPKMNPTTTADCKVLVSDITNDPPQGAVALNNAMTSKDAGASDRLESLTDLVKSKRDGFRCCYDVWAKDHAGVQGSVKMVVKLKADGSVLGVTFDDVPNRVADVEPCIAELAKSLPFPRSPSGKETTFRYPFDFKAHH
jgi:hypothetical protein